MESRPINPYASSLHFFSKGSENKEEPSEEKEKSKQFEFQKTVAKKLARFKVTAERLQECPWFSGWHQEKTLAFLLIVKGFSFEKALEMTKDLTPDEADAIEKGLTKEDVKDLTELQLRARDDFFKYVRFIDQIVRSEAWINTIQSEADLQNLKKLFDSGMDLIPALQSLAGLNEIQVSVFLRLRREGVTAEQLREDPSFNSVAHIEALERLLFEQDNTAADALSMIKGKTPEEVASLGQRKGLCLVM